MRILFVTQWFEPEPAFKGATFAAALKARGHDVEVATAFPNYPGGKVYPGYRIRPYSRETVEGITVHRLAIWPSHNSSSVSRIANYVSFFLSTLLFGLLRGGRYDLVYVYHPPITPAAAAAIFCALHRKPLVVEIQDLWPETVASSGMAGGGIAQLLGRVCAFVYRRAAMIVPQSSKMLERLRDRGVPASKLRRIYNWATYRAGDAADFPTPFEAAFCGRFNVVYGGNMGPSQAVDSLVAAAVLAAERVPSIHLQLFGGGIEQDKLKAQIVRSGPATVTMHGSVNRVVMDRIFDHADVLAVQLTDDPLHAITIPSKVQHYLACGRPVVAGLKGEAADLLRESGAALICPAGDIAAIAEAIVALAEMPVEQRREMGARGRRYYEANLGFERAIDETLAVMAEAIERSRASTRAK